MKLKQGFITHTVANEHITVATSNVNFSGIVRSNETAAFIIESLKEETTPQKIAAEMVKKWDADEAEILADIEIIIEKLRGIGAIDE